MKNDDKNYEQAIKAIYIDGVSILTRKTPVKLMLQIVNGKIDRFTAWNILRLIHAKQEKCYHPQYGILTVFSLCKDFDEFKRMYDQGIEMLLENGIVPHEAFQEATEQEKIIKEKEQKNLQKKKIIVKIKSNKNKPNNLN